MTTLTPKPITFTLDQMKEVWYVAMLQGATLWGYSQEKDRTLPDDFQRGVDTILKMIVDTETLRQLLNSTPILMGLYDEVLDKSTTIQSVAPAASKKRVPKKHKL